MNIKDIATNEATDPAGDLQNIVTRGDALLQELLSIDGRLLALRERLQGALPSDTANEPPKPVREGTVGALEDLMDAQTSIQSCILTKLDLLEQL